MRLRVISLALLWCGAGGFGDDGPWSFVRPEGDRHWYAVVDAGASLTWLEARNQAVLKGGYLATLTSRAENDFVFRLCEKAGIVAPLAEGTLVGPWLGGTQDGDSSEPADGWGWVTGEPFAFTNWAAGQPDNAVVNENSLAFGGLTTALNNGWVDLRGAFTGLSAYVVEYNGSPRTVGLSDATTNVTPGYVLMAPIPSTNTYLIDNAGRCVRQWPSAYPPGQSVYLTTSGALLRTAALSNAVLSGGGEGGRIERIAWDGTLSWAFDYSTTNVRQHHDIEPMPNGNILLLAWAYKTDAEAIAMGRDPSTLSEGALWPDHVIEVVPTGTYGGTIVWAWHVWDHLVQDFDPAKPNYDVVSNRPERIHLNYLADTRADWNHCNGIDYHPGLDQIVISSRQFCEAWVIDHSTTTAEAAGTNGGRYGRGGDLLYRWGNPAAYDAGGASDQRLFVQHNVQWIATNAPGAGHFLVFNNGTARPDGTYSSVDEWAPPMRPDGVYTQQPDGSWGPTGACWTYTATPRASFYSHHISGAQRLTNGHTLVCEGESGRLFEIDPTGGTVWTYYSPIDIDGRIVTQGLSATGNRVFRAERYPAEGPELAGLVLTPGPPVEAYPLRSDFDGDDMEDAWEYRQGLNPGVADDTEDADDDGVSNGGEYLADTSPTNAASWPRIGEGVAYAVPIEIGMPCSTARVYSLEYTDDICTGEWRGVTGMTDLPGDASGLLLMHDAQTTDRRTYRVRVGLP